MNLQELLRTVRNALDSIPGWSGVPGWVVAAVAAAGLLAVVKVARATRSVRAKAADDMARHADDIGTLVIAGLATAVSANGMWRFFGDVLNIHGPGQVILFAYLEIILAVSALRARRVVRERIQRIKDSGQDDGEGVNVHQMLVWAVAGLSGVLSTLDAPEAGAKIMRLAAPVLAATLWEIGQLADLVSARHKAGLGRRKGTIAWRVSPQRLLVWLRLAEPTARDAGEIDQTRRVTALARAAYRAHTAPQDTRRRRFWEWRLRRLAFAAINHADLGVDETVAAAVQLRLAAAYQLLNGTSEKAVAALQPWRVSVSVGSSERSSAVEEALVVDEVTGGDAPAAIEAAPGGSPFAEAAPAPHAEPAATAEEAQALTPQQESGPAAGAGTTAAEGKAEVEVRTPVARSTKAPGASAGRRMAGATPSASSDSGEPQPIRPLQGRRGQIPTEVQEWWAKERRAGREPKEGDIVDQFPDLELKRSTVGRWRRSWLAAEEVGQGTGGEVLQIRKTG